MCIQPALGGSGWVGVKIAFDGVAVHSTLQFFVYADVACSTLAPPLGPSRGGTRVAVVGGGFRDAYTLRCGFGSASAPVLARYVDESQLECSSPVHASGVVGVLLSMNGQQYASTGVSYTYQAAASVSYISPTTALSEGGTPVTVHGGGFSSASEALGLLTCRIGGAVRRAVWPARAPWRSRPARGMASRVSGSRRSVRRADHEHGSQRKSSQRSGR